VDCGEIHNPQVNKNRKTQARRSNFESGGAK